MHKGEDAEFYLRKGFRVVAFEADGDLAALGRIRLRKYLELGQLTIVEGAIVSRDAIERGEKTVQFYKNDGNSVWGTLSIDWARRNARLGSSSSVVEVDTIDLVSVLEERGIPHYMKIDIEGCDLIPVNVLNMFRERPDYISIESDKTSFKNIKREINALSALGYSSFQAVEQSTLGACNLPPCPPREGVYVSQHFEEGSSGLFGAELKAEWESRHAILRRYRAIRLGYYLLGDDGPDDGLGVPRRPEVPLLYGSSLETVYKGCGSRVV